MLYLIAGLYRPTSGSVETVSFRHPGRRPAIGALIGGTGVYPNLTVRDQVEIRRRELGLPDGETDRILREFGLEFTESVKAGYLAEPVSGRLGMALAMMGDPELLLLDEPFRGFTFREMSVFRERILALKARTGCTVVVTAEKAEDLAGLADEYMILKGGRTVLQDTTEGVQEALPGYMRLEADPLGLAKEVLDRMGIYGYRTVSGRVLNIYEQYDRIEEIREALTDAGVSVADLSLVSDGMPDSRAGERSGL